MKSFTYHTTAMGILIAVLLSVTAANAQFGDMLKKGESAGSAGGLGNLGSALSGQSVTAGSAGNVAGVLEFCIKNNYLVGDGASSVKDKLMGKLSGGVPSSDPGYSDGAKGLLNRSGGKQLNLSGGGLKGEVTKQVCDKILAQGKSLL
jgi:Protein of unknown function (DUF2501)